MEDTDKEASQSGDQSENGISLSCATLFFLSIIAY